jgi:hypothetical protein
MKFMKLSIANPFSVEVPVLQPRICWSPFFCPRIEILAYKKLQTNLTHTRPQNLILHLVDTQGVEENFWA